MKNTIIPILSDILHQLHELAIETGSIIIVWFLVEAALTPTEDSALDPALVALTILLKALSLLTLTSLADLFVLYT